jgi:hypothetical protein
MATVGTGVGFSPDITQPLDNRTVVANQAARLALPAGRIYEGLLVFQEDTNELFVLKDGTDASISTNWEIANSHISGSNFTITGSIQQTGSDSYFISKVGIGIMLPTEQLHVSGIDNQTIRIDAPTPDAKAGIRLGTFRADSDNMGDSYLYKQDSLTYFNTDSDFIIRPNGRRALQIGGNGDIQFISSSTNEVTTTTYLFGDASTKRIGINIDTPTDNLHVSESIRIGYPTGRLYAQSESGDGIFYGEIIPFNVNGETIINNHYPDGEIVFQSGSNEVARFKDGKLGIGTNNPGSTLPDSFFGTDPKLLELKSKTTSTDTGIFLRRSDNNVGADFWVDQGNAKIYIDSRYNSSAGQIRFRTRTTGTPITAMTINGDGEVGIGTVSPTYKLEVHSNNSLLLSGSGDVRFRIDKADAKKYDIVNEGNRLTIKDGDSGQSYFGIGNTGGAIVASSSTYYTANVSNDKLLIEGNVGIGTTSPTEKLEVVGNIFLSGSGTNPFIKTALDQNLTLYPSGNGHLYLGDASNGANFYHYSRHNNGEFTSYIFDQQYYNIDTNEGLGVRVKKNFTVSGSTKFGYGTTHTHQFTSSAFLNSGSYHIDTFNQGYKWNVPGSTGPNSISLTTAENLQYRAYGSHQFSGANVQILAGIHLKFMNLDNSDDIRLRNSRTGLNNSRLDIEDSSNNIKVSISSSGKVGIGDTEPTKLLTVRGDISASGDIYTNKSIKFGNSVNDYIDSEISASNDTLFIADRGNISAWIDKNGADDFGEFSILAHNTKENRVLVSSSGHVGIGDIHPTKLLTVRGDISASEVGYFGDGIVTGHGYLRVKSDANDRAISIEESGTGNNEKYGIGVNSSGDLQIFNSDDTDPNFVITDGNKVGIGITSPTANLHIFSSSASLVKIEGGPAPSSAYLNFTTNEVERWNIGVSSGETRLNFNNGTDDLVTILQTGKVGIGTTSPQKKLHIEGDSGSNLLRIERTDNGTYFDVSLEGDDLRFIPGVLDNTQNVLFGVNASSHKIASRVGIGQPLPDVELHVSGAIVADTVSASSLEIARFTASYALIEEDLTLDGNFIFQGVLFDEAVALSHTGSNVFGTHSSDFHQFTGSLIASGIDHRFIGNSMQFNDNDFLFAFQTESFVTTTSFNPVSESIYPISQSLYQVEQLTGSLIVASESLGPVLDLTSSLIDASESIHTVSQSLYQIEQLTSSLIVASESLGPVLNLTQSLIEASESIYPISQSLYQVEQLTGSLIVASESLGPVLDLTSSLIVTSESLGSVLNLTSSFIIASESIYPISQSLYQIEALTGSLVDSSASIGNLLSMTQSLVDASMSLGPVLNLTSSLIVASESLGSVLNLTQSLINASESIYTIDTVLSDLLDATSSFAGTGTSTDLTIRHITASGNISASGYITARGNISASGNLLLNDTIRFNGSDNVITTNINVDNLNPDLHIRPYGDLHLGRDFTDNVKIGRITDVNNGLTSSIGFYAGTATPVLKIIDKEITFSNPITASGDISASGTIFGKELNIDKTGTYGGFTKLANFHGSRLVIAKENNAVFLQVAQAGNEFEITDAAINNETKGNVLLRVRGTDEHDGKLLLVPDSDSHFVGIGNELPTEKLTVEGNISASGDLYVAGLDDANGSFPAVVTYDVDTGRFYYTSSYGSGGGGNGNGIFSLSSSTAEEPLPIAVTTNDLQLTGSLVISGGVLSFPGISDVSESISTLIAGGSDNLGNHTADQDLNLNTFSIKAVTNITASGIISASGVSASFIHFSDQTNERYQIIATDSALDFRIDKDDELGPVSTMTIFDSKNISIGIVDDNSNQNGITAPSGKLHIHGSTTTPDIAADPSPTGATLVLSNADPLYGMVFAIDGNGTGFIQQRRTNNTTAYPIILNREGGNVGIGTSGTPGEKLTVEGNISASNFITQTHITASGNISASGDIIATNINVSSIVVTNITASGNISASGDIIVEGNISASDELYIGGNITSSGNISASGDIIANDITASGNVKINGLISASSITASNALIEEDLTLDGNFIFSGVTFDEAVALSHTGSNIFGTQSSDFHIFTGSLIVSGIDHEIHGNNIQFNNNDFLFAFQTSSFPTTSSFNDSTGSFAVTGSNVFFSQVSASSITGSITGSLIGSLIGTSSWAYSASNAVSASYAPSVFSVTQITQLMALVFEDGVAYITARDGITNANISQFEKRNGSDVTVDFTFGYTENSDTFQGSVYGASLSSGTSSSLTTQTIEDIFSSTSSRTKKYEVTFEPTSSITTARVITKSKTIYARNPQYFGSSPLSTMDDLSYADLNSTLTKRIQNDSNNTYNDFDLTNIQPNLVDNPDGEFVYFLSTRTTAQFFDHNDFNITPDFVGEGTGQAITVKYGDGTNQTLYQYRTKNPVESINLSFRLA